MKKTTNKFAPEVRERAVRMVRDHEHEHPSRRAAETQAAAMLLLVRALLVRQRTQVANALRGHAAEFGVVAAKGIGRIEALMAAVEAAGDRRSATGQMPAAAKQALGLLANRLGQLDAELAALDRRLAALHAATPLSRLLAAVPGIGPSGFPAREHAGVPSDRPDRLDQLLTLEARILRKLAQAARTIGVAPSPVYGGDAGEQVFTETRAEIEKLAKEDPLLFEHGGTPGAAQTGEEYRVRRDGKLTR
jgi:hypothetical protein